MNIKSIFLFTITIVCIPLFISCGSTVRSVVPNPNLKLREFKKVFVSINNTSINLSVSGSTIGTIGNATISTGYAQSGRIVETLKFKLMEIGFICVNNKEEASALIELTIGEVRYDPLAGWIADQALITFTRNDTKETAASFFADSQLITPTVDNLLGNLVSTIAKYY